MEQMTQIEMIGPAPKFYGYIVGLSVEWPESDEGIGRLLAHFEYNWRRETWQVPDGKLFKILAAHLCLDAEVQALGDGGCGYAKLWIEKDAAGNWHAELP